MSEHHQTPEAPKRWIGPLVGFMLLAVVIAILVVSNPDRVPIGWAGFEWDAPLWLVLVITFVAGAILVPLGRNLVRSYRRRSRKKAFEYEEALRRAEDGG